MHYADIHCALIKAGKPAVQIGRDLGLGRASVSSVIRGTGTSYRIACAISEATNIPLNKLWPDGRYNNPRHRVKAAA